MSMRELGLSCLYNAVSYGLRAHCGQLILAIRERTVVCNGFSSPRRDLCLGIIATEPRGLMVSDDGIIIPASGHVKSQDNICIERRPGDIVLPEFFLMDTAAPWNLLTGNNAVIGWLRAQPYHPYLASDLLRALGYPKSPDVDPLST